MRIEHATLAQVQMGVGGQVLQVDDDVMDVVKRLQEIDPNLFVNYHVDGDYYTIVENCVDGVERIVTNVKTLDPGIIEYVRMIGSDGWDAVAEMEKMDAQAEGSRKHAFAEKVGEIGERLHHALRKDLGYDKDRIILPRGVTR